MEKIRVHPYFLSLLFSFLTVFSFPLIFNPTHLIEHNVYDVHTLQAQAWLSGKTNIDEDESYLEIASFKEKHYISFPPFPTLVELPFAAFLGRMTPNNFILLLFASFGVFFIYSISLLLGASKQLSIFSAASFYFGTHFFISSLEAAVWQQGQVMGVVLCLGSLLVLLTKKCQLGSFLSFFLLGLAVACRPFYLFYVIAWIAISELYQPENRHKWVASVLGIAIPLGILAAYNFARFGSIFIFGHEYLKHSLELEHGLFSFHYFFRNCYYTFIQLPFLDERYDVIRFNYRGTAFWWMSPIFVLSLMGFFSKKLSQSVKYGIGISLLLTWVGLLLHESNGWIQYGYRYGIDLIPLLVFLFAVTVKNLSRWWVIVCLFSIFQAFYIAYAFIWKAPLPV